MAVFGVSAHNLLSLTKVNAARDFRIPAMLGKRISLAGRISAFGAGGLSDRILIRDLRAETNSGAT